MHIHLNIEESHNNIAVYIRRMAKKKQSQKTLSPKNYLKERVRNLEIGKCFVTKEWQENGLANVIITRLHKGGTYTIGIYLVDTFCLGVKDASYRFSMDKLDYECFLENIAAKTEAITYNEAHNIIFAAIEFAAEGGIDPCADWEIAKYILEEDDDNVPLIDYEMGKDGKHFLVANNIHEVSKYLPILKQNLPESEIEYILPTDGVNDDEEMNDDDTSEEPSLFPFNRGDAHLVKEEVVPITLEPMSEPTLHHPELLNTFATFRLTDETIEKVLSLPHDTLKTDLEAILRYQFDLSHVDYCHDGVMNAIIMLGEVGDEESLQVILDSMRLDENFYETHLGDAASDCYIPTLIKLCKDRIDILRAYLHEAGRYWLMRAYVYETLAELNNRYPEMHTTIIECLREMITFYISALPKTVGCDSSAAGWLVNAILDTKGKELLPEVKRLYKTGLVESYICGDAKKVTSQIEKEKFGEMWSNMEIDIHKIYQRLITSFH